MSFVSVNEGEWLFGHYSLHFWLFISVGRMGMAGVVWWAMRLLREGGGLCVYLVVFLLVGVGYWLFGLVCVWGSWECLRLVSTKNSIGRE